METTRNELELKYKEQLTKLRALRMPLKKIKKVRCPIKAETLYKWFKEGKLVVADFNRDEVAKRVGTKEEWMQSLSTGNSAGIFLAYWNGKPVKETIEPTPKNPVYVYEGGHRTRWTNSVFENKVEYLDMDYATLCVVEPDTAKDIRETVIEMTVATSEDLAELKKFAKRDYDRVNQFAEVLKPGEIIRTNTDPIRAELERQMREVMKRKLKPKARNADLEDLRALVHGAAGLVDCMDKKKGSLTETDDLTPDQTREAGVVIRAFGQVENEIDALFTEKKIKTRISGRQLDLPLDGTFVYALRAAKNDAERTAVKNDIVEFHRKFFGDKETWALTLKEVKKATVERSRYRAGETPYPARWLRIQRLIRPPAETVAEETVIVPLTPQ